MSPGASLGQATRELDRGRMRDPPIGPKCELGHLRARNRGHLLAVRVADLSAEQAREGVEVTVAVDVEHVRTFAALEHEEILVARPKPPVAREVQQQVLASAFAQLCRVSVGTQCHGGGLQVSVVADA